MTTPAGAVTAGLLFLLLLAVAVDGLGTASPLAIAHGSGIVCGVLSGSSPRSVRCARVSGSRPFPLFPNVSFASVSGGRDFLCGLRSGGNSFFCWSPAGGTNSSRPKRLYNGAAPLGELAVGEDHVCASINGTGLGWWRGNRRFPRAVPGGFRSLTAGNGFSCAILVNTSSVQCWGSTNGLTGEIQAGFANASMSTIVAGYSHACGITVDGSLICSGRNDSGQLNSPPNRSPFEFTMLALGQSHSCAIRKPNNKVVCWGGAGAGGSYWPVTESLEWIVAGGNHTCGVVSSNLSVVCWVANMSSPLVTRLPLPSILPGICTEQSSCGSCGIVPDSQTFCTGSEVICKPCDNRSAEPPSPPPSTPASPSRRRSKGLLAFAIVGSVGSFAGVCTILYCLWTGVCRQKKVHNSVKPSITGAASAASNGGGAAAPGLVSTPFSSPSKSRSRSRSLIFGRQGSRVMHRQRSGPSSMKYTDRAEEFSFGDLAAATKNFSLETKIGAGSFGTVYRGKLADGREVAIKRGESGPRAKKFQEKESAFQSELAFLSRLHHKHLVGLVGYCEDREERLLVYEYMKNGALYDHLHTTRHNLGGGGNGGGNGSGNGGGVLNSWKMRIKILLDAARGIEYLHNYAVPPIIHRDIKSSNILLDGSWTAKVSDFGLSLNGPEGGEGHLSLKAAGTVGYMDPEYYGLHHLTVKSDVYGLGVVMLEVLTGRRAIFKDGDGNPISVVDYAVPRIAEGEVGRVLDARVGAPGASEAEAVELVAYTAVHCVSLEGRERPTMADIVSNLESALALCDDTHGSLSSASNSMASND